MLAASIQWLQIVRCNWLLQPPPPISSWFRHWNLYIFDRWYHCYKAVKRLSIATMWKSPPNCVKSTYIEHFWPVEILVIGGWTYTDSNIRNLPEIVIKGSKLSYCPISAITDLDHDRQLGFSGCWGNRSNVTKNSTQSNLFINQSTR